MSVKISYFVHGTTYGNEDGIPSGWDDVDLSPLGIQQAKDLAGLTSSLTFDAVFTSDLKRAVHTAKLCWDDKYPTFTDKRLRECNYGDLNGKDSELVEPIQERSIHTPMPNGESYEDVKNRIEEFLDFVRVEYPNGHIAIVAHKAPQLALDVLLKGMTWDEAFAADWRKTKSWQPGWIYSA